MKQIRVFAADDHQIMIDGLRLMFSTEPDIDFVAHAKDGNEAYHLLSTEAVDVALLDISMPGINGIELTRLLTLARPELKIIGLSMLQEVSLIKSMLYNGAVGFLPKNAGQDEVVLAVRQVVNGHRYIAQPISELLVTKMSKRRSSRVHLHFPALSRREKEVLRLILNERTTAEIASTLYVSVGTVETHRRNMLTKLGVRNTAGLVRKAVEYRLLDEN